jgi:pimeloyl-ACP methyl ester carboxylesterase
VTRSSRTITGPYRHIGLPEGGRAPCFIIPFDKDGACSGPRTRAALIEQIATGEPSHVFLFSHGWNNTWPTAIDKYTEFIEGFARMRAQNPLPGRFRPTIVGIFWPSAILVSTEDKAPDIAAGGTSEGPEEDGEWLAEIMALAEEIEPGSRERFYELAQAPSITSDELAELAGMLTPVWAGRSSDSEDADELRSNPELDPDELVDLWREAASMEEPSGAAPAGVPAGPFAEAPGTRSAPATLNGPSAAGVLDTINPRNIARTATVLLMKDRAGRVGARGVARLLEDVLAATDVPVHLVGHSYGCKVVMSALCRVSPSARPVESALLLQPAMSYLAFAPDVPGLNAPGGYRPALERCVQPVRATYSRFDIPLTKLFHLAVRRASDLGEVQIAAGAPPSRYSALGGFGPAERPDTAQVAARPPGSGYDAPAGVRVVGVEASKVISGHSDISNDATWWMLLDQVLGRP